MPAAAGSATVGLADRLFVVGSGSSSFSSASSSASSSSAGSAAAAAAAALGPLSGGSLARSLSLVASALRLSTRKSIVVLDECGAGTLSSDGAGIAAASAAFLGSRGVRALLPTHHGELAQSSLMSRLGAFGLGGGSSSMAERVGVAAMKVLSREVEGEEAEEGVGGGGSKSKTLVITPLFRLEPAPDGPAPAYGLAAAAAAGMPASVVRRAAAVAAAAASKLGGGRGRAKASNGSLNLSSACDPRLSAACARDARRAAALLARVATLPLATVQAGRLCDEAKALLKEALLEEEREG